VKEYKDRNGNMVLKKVLNYANERTLTTCVFTVSNSVKTRIAQYVNKFHFYKKKES